MWAVAYLADGGSDHIQTVIDSGLVSILVPLLGHYNENVQVMNTSYERACTELHTVDKTLHYILYYNYIQCIGTCTVYVLRSSPSVIIRFAFDMTQLGALRAAGNISTGSDEQTQTLLHEGALDYFAGLLKHPNVEISKACIWCVSNVAAGDEAQVQAVIVAGLVPLVVELMVSRDFATQKEAAWAVSNLSVSGNVYQCAFLIHCGSLDCLHTVHTELCIVLICSIID